MIKKLIVILIVILLMGCFKDKSQINFLEDLEKHEFYLYKDKIPVLALTDSTAVDGIYEVFFYFSKAITKEELIKNINDPLEAKNFSKVVFFAGQNDIEEVPADFNEGESIGWMYDYKFPCDISIYIWTSEKEWNFYRKQYIENGDDYKSLINRIESELIIKESDQDEGSTSKNHKNNFNNPEKYDGSYENGLVISYDKAHQKFTGSIDYETTIKCKLQFFGYFKNIKNKNEIPIEIKGFDIDGLLNGVLFLEEDFVKIQFGSPTYCQNILDFRNGEVFFKQ